MTVTLTYDAALSRVRVTADQLGVTAAYAVVDRSTDGIAWSTLRGGSPAAVAAAALAVPVDDYEFPVSTSTTYRVRSYDAADVQLTSQTAAGTFALTQPWLKNMTRAWLNRPLTVVDWTDPTLPARGGSFDVVGRSFPVGVTDVRGSLQYGLDVMLPTPAAAEDFRQVLAAGDVVLLHLPAGHPLPGSTRQYHMVGNVTGPSRRSRRGPRRYFTLPLVEHAAPDAGIVPTTASIQSVVNAYATIADVVTAFATVAALLELVGAPGDVIVP